MMGTRRQWLAGATGIFIGNLVGALTAKTVGLMAVLGAADVLLFLVFAALSKPGPRKDPSTGDLIFFAIFGTIIFATCLVNFAAGSHRYVYLAVAAVGLGMDLFAIPKLLRRRSSGPRGKTERESG
jgi:hypothetical protein